MCNYKPEMGIFIRREGSEFWNYKTIYPYVIRHRFFKMYIHIVHNHTNIMDPITLVFGKCMEYTL